MQATRAWAPDSVAYMGAQTVMVAKKKAAKSVAKRASAKPAPAAKRKGRPSLYSAELAARVLDSLASGLLIPEVCALAGMPSATTVREWASTKPDFATAYARARELGCDAIVREAKAILDTKPRMAGSRNGGTYVDSGHVNWLRNRAEFRLKVVAAMDPTRWGNKVAVDGTVNHNHNFTDQFAQAMASVVSTNASDAESKH